MRNRPTATPRRWQAAAILALFTAAVAAAAFLGWWYARESPPHQGPIVLISADSLSGEQWQAAADRQTSSPAIDALAHDAVTFDRAYTHSPQTVPAVASLLTGQLPFEHGVRDDAGFTLKDEARTLAELLRGRGFATGGAASSFLLRRGSGIAQGFSFYDARVPAEDPQPDATAVERDGLQTFVAAEQWIRTQNSQRYFLFLAVDGESADMVIARLVQTLKERKLYDGATIIFTADRGDESSGASLDDRTLLVPLLMKQPSQEGAGRHVDRPVQHIDLVPTVLDLVRAPIPGGLRGRSLRSVLDDEDGTVSDQPIYAESLEAAFRFGGYPLYALTTARDRLVRGPREELTRLRPAADDGIDDTRRIRDLGALLDRHVGATAIQVTTNVRAADEARLAAFGFLPGLRTWEPPQMPLDAEEQAALLDAHRAAARLVSNKAFTAAIAALRGIVRTHPVLAPVHVQIASLLARNGRFTDALNALMTADTLRPDDPQVAIMLASTALRAQDLEAAKEYAAAAVTRADGGDRAFVAAAHEVATRVALVTRDAEAATMHAAEAQRANPSLPLPQFVRGKLAYDDARYEEAVSAFQEAEQTLRNGTETLTDLHLYFGDALARLDRYSEAEAEFRQELRVFPENIRAYSSLAMLYQASNREQAVDQTIDELVETAPTPEGYAAAVRLWTIVGERERAEALRADARRRFRGDPSLANSN